MTTTTRAIGAPSHTSDTGDAEAPRFRDLGLPRTVGEVLAREGIHRAFPIQAATIPPALAGRDLCGRAPTGSGKTLAFAIPTVENTRRDCAPHHPGALLLAPTRELATQIQDTLLPLAKARGLWVSAFYGGTSVNRDIARLRKGVDIVVGTPGRLEDLVQQGELHFDEVRVVVIDEADRMADMGFLPVVRRLLDRTHRDRQTLLFSATLDGDVDVLVRRYQRDPVVVEIDESEEEQGDVRHLFWEVDRTDRKALTVDVLRRSGSTIVFTRTKRGADRLAKQLAKGGLSTAAIHGNRSQNQRERALAQFAAGQVTALVATDVAARGIHVDDVDTVLHFDLPATEKDYVHRSGRTGRAGRDGVVVSLVLEDQSSDLRALQRGLDGLSGTDAVDLEAITVGSRARTAPSPAGGAARRQRTGDGGGGRLREDRAARTGATVGAGERRPAGTRSVAERSDGRPDRRADGTGSDSSTTTPRTSGGARHRSRRRGQR